MTQAVGDVIVDYLLSQRLAGEEGVYHHANRIEQLLEQAGWVIEPTATVMELERCRDRLVELEPGEGWDGVLA